MLCGLVAGNRPVSERRRLVRLLRATIVIMWRAGFVLGLGACSFLTAAGNGTTEIHKRHEYVDLAGMLVSEAVCFVGIVAWQSPDAFAPVQDDPNSWAPGDRDSTIVKGATAAQIGCTAAVGFMVSGLYGRHYANQNDGDDQGGGGNWDPSGAAAVGAAFANGFLGARQQTIQQAPTYAPPQPVAPLVTRPSSDECSSDFSCGVGYVCVKANFASRGRCAKAVDDVGVPTYQTPSLDSVGPKMPDPHDCDFDMDCPVGFRCEPKSGACIK